MAEHPSTPIDDRELPTPIAETLRAAFGFDERPETLGDWAADVARQQVAGEDSVGVDDLCTVDDSRHEVYVGDETRHFRCVLDTLLLPFVAASERAVEVTSRSPVSDDPVEIRVTDERIDVRPPEAVMSFGAAAGIEPRDAEGISRADAYAHLCPYVNAFRSRAEYERWAAETTDAVTIAVPMADGFELARVLEASLATVTD